MGFPIELPFSPTYPLCCIDIRNMITQFRQFSEGATSLQAGDELLREALNRLLTNSVVESIGEKIRNTSNLPGLAQIVANLEFFNVAAEQISSHTLTTRYEFIKRLIFRYLIETWAAVGRLSKSATT